MIRRLAVIPARGGSKRLPRKNVKSFCGQPMINYILSAAVNSDLFTKIHVSTDDTEIARAATDIGCSPEFMRPAHLADDVTPLMPVLKYVVEEYANRGQSFDQIWLLMACAPLVEKEDLQKAADAFERGNIGSAVMAVSQYSAPIEWAYTLSIGGLLVPEQPGKFAIRSQDLAPKYHDAGLFYAFPVNMVIDSAGAGDDTRYQGYFIDRSKSIDIDDEESWLLAEAVYQGRFVKEKIHKARLKAFKEVMRLRVDADFEMRPFKEEDITSAYVDGLNDPEVRRFLTSSSHDLDSVTEFCRLNDGSDTDILLGIFHQDTHIGNIRLHDINWLEMSCYLGIAIFRKEYWGRNIATRMLKIAVEFCFNSLQISEIRAGINQRNIASKRIFENTGFSQNLEDEVIWCISKSTFETQL